MAALGGRAAAGRRRRAGTTQRVLAAAAELFAALGYAQVRVEDIARRAGVSPATVYTRFGTKGALVAEIFRPEVERLGEAARADVAAGLPIEECVARHVARVHDLARLQADLFVPLVRALVDVACGREPVAPEHDPRRIADLPQPLAALLEEGQRQGKVRADVEPYPVAAAWTNALVIQLVAGLNPRYSVQLQDVFLRGLQP